MIKILFLSLVTTIITLAQGSFELQKAQINKEIAYQEYKYAMYGVDIQDREFHKNGESYVLTLDAPFKDGNQTIPSPFTGFKLLNEIKYVDGGFQEVLSLVSLPDDTNLSSKNKTSVDKFIKNKTLQLTQDYNLATKKYHISMKDINETTNELKIVVKDTTVDGIYDIDNMDEMTTDLKVGQVLLKIEDKDFFKINNLSTQSGLTPIKDTYTMYSDTAFTLLDIFMDDQAIRVDNFNIDTKITNINIASFKALMKFMDGNPQSDIEDPKMIEALANLLNNDIVVHINDISADNVTKDNESLGGFKIFLKVSIDGNQDVKEMIKINPLMALSVLNIEAKIEISPKGLKAVMATPKGGMLAMLPSKKVKDNYIYNISYKQGKLLVNSQPLN